MFIVHNLQSYKRRISPSGVQSVQLEKFIARKTCRPCIRIGQVLGIIPWDIHFNSINQNGKIRCKHAVNIVYLTLAKIVIMSIISVHIKFNFSFSAKENAVYAHVNEADDLIAIGWIIFINIFYIFNVNRVSCMLHFFENSEKHSFDSLKSGYCRLKHIVPHFILTFMDATLFTANVIVFSNHDSTRPFFLMLYIVRCGHDLFISTFFISCANLCAEFISHLNMEFKELFSSNVELNDHLDYVQRQYNELYHLAESVQHVFSLLITLMLGYLSFTVCFLSYYVLNTSVIKDGYFVGDLFAIIVNVYRLFTITSAAGNITKQARLGSQILQDSPLQYVPSWRASQAVVLLSNKLNHNPPEITAAGHLFQINTGTFTTIVGTIITYLIILMQYKSDPKELTYLNTSATNST